MENIDIQTQEIRTEYIDTIPNVENFTKELLSPIFNHIIDTNFVKEEDYKYLEENFPNILELVKPRSKGIPDLICFYNKEILFVEVKNEKDSLRFSQIDWANKFPEFKIKVLVWENRRKESIENNKIEKLNLEISDLQYENKKLRKKIYSIESKSKYLIRLFQRFKDNVEEESNFLDNLKTTVNDFRDDVNSYIEENEIDLEEKD